MIITPAAFLGLISIEAAGLIMQYPLLTFEQMYFLFIAAPTYCIFQLFFNLSIMGVTLLDYTIFHTMPSLVISIIVEGISILLYAGLFVFPGIYSVMFNNSFV